MIWNVPIDLGMERRPQCPASGGPRRVSPSLTSPARQASPNRRFPWCSRAAPLWRTRPATGCRRRCPSSATSTTAARPTCAVPSRASSAWSSMTWRTRSSPSSPSGSNASCARRATFRSLPTRPRASSGRPRSCDRCASTGRRGLSSVRRSRPRAGRSTTCSTSACRSSWPSGACRVPVHRSWRPTTRREPPALRRT